ncbi:short subunit dehydrogenase [Ureibacillus xyleni]|uniref:Short subunit dehydrogenase n=2 Tax=Ureibacillus xyleni TaxID=614648 RepID=A0A285TQF2_9BACL|nr:short subunit dehydrogenase [Ureibacillus xyleni]
MSEFENKIAIVTGAAGGIGEEICDVLAGQGIHVVMADKSPNLELIYENFKTKYPENKGFAVTLDLTQESEVENLVNQTVERLGRLDIMVNNAGVIQSMQAITELPLEVVNFVMDVNFKGVFLGSKYAARQMKKQKSCSIINTGSWYGKRGYKYFAGYCCLAIVAKSAFFRCMCVICVLRKVYGAKPSHS